MSLWWCYAGAIAALSSAGSALATPPPARPNPLDPPFVPPPAEPPPVIEAPTSGRFDPNLDDEESKEPEARRAITPAEVTGIESPERERGDTMREVGNVLLSPPRESFGVLFYATRTAATIVEQRQIVPKINEFTRQKEGAITIFPTLFFDPGRSPAAGAFMVTGGPSGTSTSIRVGTGGPNEVLLETRVAVARASPRPFSIVGEALYDMRTNLEYRGVGQDPQHDKRNEFAPLRYTEVARYRHQRLRTILSGGFRPTENTEILLSSSYTTHVIDDAPGDPNHAMSFIFERVPGGPTAKGAAKSHIVYSEMALRLDTREELGPPSEGAYTEGYIGYGAGVAEDPTQYMRFGFRGAIFLAIFRKKNILSPKLVVDQVQPLTKAPVPFYELARESDFRGFHRRRDSLSTTASLDYRWGFAPQISGRLFVDLNSVGPELSKLGGPRWVVGFGQDIYASAHDIGSWALAFGPEGVSFFLSFGVPNSFGDRQHRE